MPTGKVVAGSELVRKSWQNETLEALGKSFGENYFAPYIGSSFGSSIVTTVNPSAGAGHSVVFDFDADLEGALIVGTSVTLYGSGEEKRKMSLKTFMEELGTEVNNGTKFDLVNIGVDAPTNDKNHRDSIRRLSSVYNHKIMPQIMFDTAQSCISPLGEAFQDPRTTILGVEFSGISKANPVINRSHLNRISMVAETGEGFDTAPAGVTQTIPMNPVTADGASNKLFFFVDPYIAEMIRNGDLHSLFQNADVRGTNNRAITGVLNEIGNITIVVAPKYIGRNLPNTTNTDYWPAEEITGYDAVSGTRGAINVAGMRRYDIDSGAYEGTTGFSAANTMRHRCFLIGASAFLYGKGMPPQYKLQESTDYSRTSRSGLLWWAAVKKIVLTADSVEGDNTVGKVVGMDNFLTIDFVVDQP